MLFLLHFFCPLSLREVDKQAASNYLGYRRVFPHHGHHPCVKWEVSGLLPPPRPATGVSRGWFLLTAASISHNSHLREVWTPPTPTPTL